MKKVLLLFPHQPIVIDLKNLFLNINKKNFFQMVPKESETSFPSSESKGKNDWPVRHFHSVNIKKVSLYGSSKQISTLNINFTIGDRMEIFKKMNYILEIPGFLTYVCFKLATPWPAFKLSNELVQRCPNWFFSLL